jgi:hypothetical protein
VDIEYLRQLSRLTNIIPVLAQMDKYTAEQIQQQKRQVLSELCRADIKPFLFGMTCDEALTSCRPVAPYAVSSVTTTDADNMDASLLMSPDYVQPLLSTELSTLVEQVFDRDNISWLRHTAAKKIIQWRNGFVSNSSRSPGLHSALHLQTRNFGHASMTSSSASSHVLVPPIGAASSYALARVADHTQREERFAQVRLAKWASDLQQSIKNEKARFEALCRGERAVWLTERLGECVQDGSLVPITWSNEQKSPDRFYRENALIKHGTERAHNATPVRMHNFDPGDPLGILQLNADMRHGGLVALQVLGGCGIVGGVVLWLVKTWTHNDEITNWGFEWSRLGMDW